MESLVSDQSFMDDRTAMYNAPETFTNDLGTPLPRVSVRASRDEMLKLYSKLAATGRLAWFPEDEICPRRASGLFSVPKSLDSDRLIMDSRPPNACEVGLNFWTKLASSFSTLLGIELDSDEKLLLSGQDIRNFYYQFVVTSARGRRNVLSGKLSREELQQIFGSDGSYPPAGGFVSLNSLAMGDICACEFAQSSHVGLLLQCGALLPEELLMMGQPCPRTKLRVGIVIDDLVMLEVVAKNVAESVSVESDRRMDMALGAYADSGLPVNAKKAFHRSEAASFWGVSVDGNLGILRPNPARLWPLIMVTWRICSLGVCTLSLLESLAGSWISIFSVRRRFMSLMEIIFQAVSCGAAASSIVRLSRELRDELLSFCILGPMVAVNLRATTLGEIHATDSSGWGSAAVSAEISCSLAREAMRFSLSKSTWSQLLPPGKAWMKLHGSLEGTEELPDGFAYDTHPLWEMLARVPEYAENWRRPHRASSHINLTELAAHLKQEARIALKLSSVRVLYGLDSQVSLGALVKGRAASSSINNLLRRSLPVVLGSDMYGGYGYFPSAINRADGPTRGVAPPAPDMDEPSWWHFSQDVDYLAFDRWMQEDGRASAEHCDPDFRSLGYVPGDLVSAASGKKFAFSKFDIKSKCEATAAEASMDEGSAGSSCGELSREAVAMLRSFPARQFWWPKGSDRCFNSPGALDLYTGKGGVARALLRFGCPFVLTFDWLRDSSENLLDRELQLKLLKMVRLGCFKLTGSAIICRSFSKAITPCCRSPRFPRGVPWMRQSMKQHVKEGNAHADFCAEMLEETGQAGGEYWLENPDTSYLWCLRQYRQFRDPASRSVFRADYCRFGTRWRKRTRVATSIEGLMGVRVLCKGDHNHQILRGTHPRLGIPWTAVAEPYPRGFSAMIGKAACLAVGWSRDRLDVAGCSRTGTLRAGEASHPGPRLRRAPRGFSLEEVPVLGLQSLRIADDVWEAFLTWVRTELASCAVMELFVQVPLFLAHAVRRFGDREFAAGGSLLRYRHLILTSQRRIPTLRPYVHLCWELASRWENVEPVVHRVPIPVPLIQAMVAVAWNMGWRRWSAVTMICFSGIARLGEVLKCKRRDLLLPSDLLEEHRGCAFVVLWESKTSQVDILQIKVQHLRITDSYTINLLETAYGGSDPSESLYQGSPSVYRHRWNSLLTILQVPSSCRLTPGGLRGGGAVEAYRNGVGIYDIQWRMRVRSQSTLESYIQEVAAISVLSELDHSTLHSVRCASQIFRIQFSLSS